MDKDKFLKEQIITYLGNKRKMVPFFGEIFTQNINPNKPFSFLDGFSGSGIVSRYAKTVPNISQLISNDWEYYSFCINSCYLQNIAENSELNHNIKKAIDWCNENKYNYSNINYIYGNYSPKNDTCIEKEDRVYFTSQNAKLIDSYRSKIDLFHEYEKYYLLGPLLYDSSIHNNTCGYFNSFYKDNGVGKFGGKNKNDLQRICGEINLKYPVFFNNEYCDIQVCQKNIMDLVENVNVDIAYFDPPYNKHPYGTYYFMLNTIAKWETDKLVPDNFRGQTNDWKRSKFNSFTYSESEFDNLIQKTKAHQIWISYNNLGLISIEKIQQILSKYGSFIQKDFNHATYEKLLGQGKKFREKSIPNVKESFFILNKKR